MVKRVLVLGSTGSVGTQTLDVLSALATSHRVVGLAARRSADLLSRQAHATRPEAVCLVDEAAASALDLPDGCARLHGADGLVELVERTRPDVVVCAVTGAAGLPSTLAAAETGAVVALANKESLVLAGHLVKRAVQRSGGTLVPVDSEHSAIAQCLAGEDRGGVRRLVLTASGGPFRGRTRAELREVTVAQALRHPSWEMGPRITIDSATLMNKALEVIEACHLFDVPQELVHVVVHPQSIVHSMVEFVDGAVIAQLSPPDMRLPIRYALGYPSRVPSGQPPVDFTRLPTLTFEQPDRETFPCLALGERAARAGGLAGTILNAANEITVEAFLSGRLPFLEIATLVGEALDRFPSTPDPDLPTILETDAAVRRHVASRLPQPTR
ncbi:MAG: 1-deoxy-D-xylulose-5-phosphate reductoisomerase [Planctomycetes bacterium]|nr:1-deoxy-D-xylulose-5-phosphate reductoisomerase [Planctomycetota bacterium]